VSVVAALPVQHRLVDLPMAGLYPLHVDRANHLLTAWGHKLGPVHRPFTQVAYALEIGGETVAVAVSGSTVSATVAGYRRTEVVELTRLCAVPGNAWANRVLLRLWREVCAPAWPGWAVQACISYSHNAMHHGDLYRADGWVKVTDKAGFTSGSNYGRGSEDYAAAGKKTLWVWIYDELARDVARQAERARARKGRTA